MTFKLYSTVLMGNFTRKIELAFKNSNPATDWGKATAEAIDAQNVEVAKKYAFFSHRDSRNLNGSQMGSAFIEFMSENLVGFKLSPMMSFTLFVIAGSLHIQLKSQDNTSLETQKSS